MNDLETAKKRLRKKSLSLVIVKSGRIVYETNEYGVVGLVEAIEKHVEGLARAAVADKIMGRAAAMLCRYAGVSEAYADVMSEKGLNMLREGGIRFEYGELVPEILNRTRSDICPFEKLVAGCTDEEECYEKIKKSLEKQ